MLDREELVKKKKKQKAKKKKQTKVGLPESKMNWQREFHYIM